MCKYVTSQSKKNHDKYCDATADTHTLHFQR